MKNYCFALATILSASASATASTEVSQSVSGRESNSADEPLIVRLRAGYSSLANTGVVESATGAGFDFGLPVANSFGLGGSFYYSQGGKDVAGTGVNSGWNTKTTQSFAVFGLTPYLMAKRNSARVYVGAFVGAVSISRKVNLSTGGLPGTESSTSLTAFAVGPNGGIDVLLSESMFIGLKGEYLRALGRSEIGMMTASFGVGAQF